MALPPRTRDATITRGLDSVAAGAAPPAGGGDIHAGRLLSGIALSGTPLQVAHGLGRAPVGFILVKSSADVRIFEPGPAPDPSTFLNLQASASATVSIWVF